MKKLVELVQQWSVDKGLDKADSRGQFLKVVEEVGEVAAALCRNDLDALKDGIGDVVVTIIIYAQQNDIEDFTYLTEAEPLYGYDHFSTNIAIILEELGTLFFRTTDMTHKKIDCIDVCMSSLNGLAKDNNLTLKECLQAAYDVIKGRTGEMRNGTFIKSEDLPKPEYNPDTWLNKKGSIAGHK